MRLVPIECAKNGTFLAKTIFDNNGRLLLREGMALNDKYVRRIKELGIYSIYIKDEYSNVEIEDVIKPEIRQKSIKTLKDSFASVNQYIPASNENFSNTALNKSNEYFDSIASITEEILEELTSKRNIMVNLVDIKSMDNYTYQHSVNVAVLSLVLGIQLQLNKRELYKLCTGALLHDIGKVFIPENILNKEEKLTLEEFEIIKSHSLKGYDYLKGNLDISPLSRVIVLQHHEKVDGTGYPDAKKDDEINKFARIVAIADVYDALTSDRPYRRAMCPNEAVEYILGSGQKHFDYNMTKAFLKCIVPYPEGTLVRLNNDDIGVVIKTYQNFALRPMVEIIKSNEETHIGKNIDLMEKLDLVIKNVEYNID
jgi:HD-GYP domain-containing protein (c-di-GMP phosphodiesterase class II)